MQNIPWVEKYRPNVYENIIMDTMNKTIFNSILSSGHFPHLLLYGPPGTGKTTTILNFIKQYLEKHYQYNKELIIHLNASDDRGIDIIRNQINTFIDAKHLFTKGYKFIILDEVDHMTKNAQQALRMFVNKENVRFCLICNYISCIDNNLRYECISLRFHRLPTKPILSLLEHICKEENVTYEIKWLESIITEYKSDIRSMINYIQSSSRMTTIMTNEHLHNIIQLCNDENQDVQHIMNEIESLCISCMCSKNHLFIRLCHYIMDTYIVPSIYQKIQSIVHKHNVQVEYKLMYIIHMILDSKEIFFTD